jgi:chromosome segregation ATPase
MASAVVAMEVVLGLSPEQAEKALKEVPSDVIKALAVLAVEAVEADEAVQRWDARVTRLNKEIEEWKENQQLTYNKMALLSKKNKALKRQIERILNAQPGEFVEIDAR